MVWKAHIIICVLGLDCAAGVSSATYATKALCIEEAKKAITSMEEDAFPRILVSTFKCKEVGAKRTTAYVPIPALQRSRT